MMNQNRQRVTLITVLLVIILGSIVFFALTTIEFPLPLLPNANSVTITPESVYIESNTTPLPTDFQNQYDYHQSRGELQVALYHLEANAILNGWTVDSHIRAGNLWRDMGDNGRALPHWESANAQEANANLLRRIAEIYLERGEWGTAWERIQILLTLAPNDAWALYHSGLILAPSDPVTAYGYLGQVASLDNAYSETAQAMLDAIGDTQSSSDVILRVGSTLAAAEEWSLAENAYQYAADLYYPFAEATAYAGLMRILQGKNGDTWISGALALAPDNPTIHYIAGVYWRSAGEYLTSEDELLQAILLEPDNPTFHTELGNTYRAMGNLLDAEVWLQTAVILSGEDPLMLAALESFYEDEAFLSTQSFSGVDPGASDTPNPAAISANGWALHVRGDSIGGLALINQALAFDPDNPRALFDKARVFLDNDRLEEAIPLLQQLMEGNSVFAGPAQGLLEREQE